MPTLGIWVSSDKPKAWGSRGLGRVSGCWLDEGPEDPNTEPGPPPLELHDPMRYGPKGLEWTSVGLVALAH